MDKGKIRPFYSEFQGYLSQAPEPKSPSELIYDHSLPEHYNEAIKLLNSCTNEDFNRFCVNPQSGSKYVEIMTYRQKLGGLISHLYGRYFSDEPPPFSGMPTTVITQTQQQNQTIQMVLEIRDRIDAKIPDFSEESKERKFLENLKGMLGSISTWGQLLSQIFKTANDFGLDLNSINKIFG